MAAMPPMNAMGTPPAISCAVAWVQVAVGVVWGVQRAGFPNINAWQGWLLDLLHASFAPWSMSGVLTTVTTCSARGFRLTCHSPT